MHTQNIKMSILPFVLVLALLLPSNALAARSAADTVPVKAKFSRGGLRLDISNTTPYWGLILNMTSDFLRWDQRYRSPNRHVSPLSERKLHLHSGQTDAICSD